MFEGPRSTLSPGGNLALEDAFLREIEWSDPARLARGLEAIGATHISLLESGLPESPWGIWTFLAWNPARALEHRRGIWSFSGGEKADARAGSDPFAFVASLAAEPQRPWQTLSAEWEKFARAGASVGAGTSATGPRAPLPAGTPRPPFRGGWMIALSYDAARALDDFAPWKSRATDDLDWPWFDLRITGALLAFHHPSARAFAVASRHPAFGAPEEALDRMAANLSAARRAPSSEGGASAPSPAELHSNMTDAEYGAAFERVQEYLRAGDLYQANLTRRFDAPSTDPASLLYARLRERARAPYGALFTAPDRAVVSASPELFLARDGQRLVTRPIKGTRPRGGDAAEDARLMAELAASPKDRAEHVMIVDVHRNDLGRVCDYGTVRAETLAGHEVFLTVHHLTSTITGTLRAGVGSWEAIAAAFPAGSITGAPKRRAIEVLEELEPTRRAQYTGGLGWMGFDGNFGLNVAIRTILVSQGRASYQAGGGIVIDSKLDEEAAETWSKARAMHAAVSARAG
ncbi:MAG: anthranilate synthase component I family protein [Candidatus Eiseniibacteriota bacterium]